ncbi:hypothetical protein TNCV_1900471 [Trichonephila clavipes]|nr:hypothetical protein TNCV_1900471 [Trichonephila clavipes]
MPGVKKSRLPPTIANGASANKSGVVAKGKKTLKPKQRKNCHHPETQSLPLKRSNHLNESKGDSKSSYLTISPAGDWQLGD